MIRVVIIDDHTIIRASLRALIADHTDLRVIADFARAKAAVAHIAAEKTDVVLLDLAMPGMSGMEAVPALREASPSTRILVFTALPAELYGPSLVKLGASGFLDKTASGDEIADAVRAVYLGGRVIPDRVRTAVDHPHAHRTGNVVHERLSPRELEVFLSLAKGSRLTDVAGSMGLSIKTASTYRGRVLEKLNLSSNPELTRYAMANGLIA